MERAHMAASVSGQAEMSLLLYLQILMFTRA